VALYAGGCPVGINFNSATGTIMKGIKLFPIYYGSWTDAQINITNRFLAGLGGSAWWGVNARYTDAAGNNPTAGSMFPGQFPRYATAASGTTLTGTTVRVCWVGTGMEQGMVEC
jgi:hypothetical protein